MEFKHADSVRVVRLLDGCASTPVGSTGRVIAPDACDPGMVFVLIDDAEGDAAWECFYPDELERITG